MLSVVRHTGVVLFAALWLVRWSWPLTEIILGRRGEINIFSALGAPPWRPSMAHWQFEAAVDALAIIVLFFVLMIDKEHRFWRGVRATTAVVALHAVLRFVALSFVTDPSFMTYLVQLTITLAAWIPVGFVVGHLVGIAHMIWAPFFLNKPQH